MKKTRRLISIGMLLVMVLTMAGCGGQNNTAEEEDIQCGIMNWQEPSDLEIFPKPALGEWKEYSNLTSMVLDLNAGNVEYLLVPSSVANYLKAQDDSLTLLRLAPVSPQRYGWQFVRKIQNSTTFTGRDSNVKNDGSLDTLVDTYTQMFR